MGLPYWEFVVYFLLRQPLMNRKNGKTKGTGEMIEILKETPAEPITLMGQRAGVCWGGDIQNKEKNYRRRLDCIK